MEYEYIYHSIVNNSIIKYNSMRVKHQKKLIETADNILEKNQTAVDFIEQFKDIILELISIDKDKLYYSDFENLMFLIRGKSFGDVIQYYKIINGKKITLEFNINTDIKLLGELHKDKANVKLTDNRTVVIKPLLLEEQSSIDYSKNKVLQNFDILSKSLYSIVTDDEVLKFSTEFEKQDFIDGLSIENLKRIKNEYNTFPKITTKKLEVIDEKEYEIDFGDIESNFFVIS